MDIWDGGRDREGNTSGQGLRQLKRLKKKRRRQKDWLSGGDGRGRGGAVV